MVSKKKSTPSKRSQTSKKPTSSPKRTKSTSKAIQPQKGVGPRTERVKVDDWLNEFNGKLKDKEYESARNMIQVVRGVSRWQKLNLLSSVAAHERDLKLCEDLMRQAIREKECKPLVKRNLAGLLVSQGRMNEALPFCQVAAKEDRKDLKALQLYLNCLLDMGQGEQVLKVVEESLKNFPDDKSVLIARASALRSTSQETKAELEIDALIKRFPEEPVVHRLKADLWGDRDSSKAIKYYDTALEASQKINGQNDPAIEWNMSLHLLRTRDFKRGWPAWEQGFHKVVGTMGRNLPPRVRNLPRADKLKKIDKNKWTFVVAEQGIGDQVLFMSVLQDFVNEHGKVIYVCEERIHPILERSFKGLEIAPPGITFDWEDSSVDKNGYIPLGSLPGKYIKDVKDFEKYRKPFFKANGHKYKKYRNHLSKIANGRPIIGISWKGGYWQIQRKTKALQLENWKSIFKKNALFVNLQYGDISEDLAYLKKNEIDITCFPKVNFRTDLDDWLAIAAACDGIISISTALVHFAGAIGQKVALIMPEKQGPWILGLSDTQSLIYKNVRIYRREKGEKMSNLIDKVASIIIE
jgi:tetratricopeptide (TPR) repeat protein